MPPEEAPKKAGQVPRPPRRPRNFVFLLLFLIIIVMLIWSGKNLTGSGQETEVGEKSYLAHIEDPKHRIDEVVVQEEDRGGILIATVNDPGWKVTKEDGKVVHYKRIRVVLPEVYFNDNEAWMRLSKNIPPRKFHARKRSVLFYQYFLPLVPWVLLILLTWYFFFRQIRSAGGPGNVLSFGKSRAQFITAGKVSTRFSDVAGIDEAKEELSEIIEFLRDPHKFQRLGGRLPRGVLLVGAPGTGKTLLAKAIAGEANVPFLSISGSDFVEMFVGVGASRVRDVFKTAKESSPCIIFLDEIDAVGRRRGTGLGGGHDEREQTLNQILVEMDGFETDQSVIIVAATNRADILDPALLRPGRFDRQVIIDLPDVKGREEILRIHAKKIKLARPEDLKTLARATPMMTGADLASLLNEAAILATMKRKDQVELEDLEEARDKVLWGRQKKSRVVVEEEKKIAAYHEAGHTLVASLQPECDPIHKVTIIPRGRAGGATMSLPERDRYMLSKKYCLAQLAVLFGGRIAEELFFPDISSGAQDDIRRATQLARSMICEYGMSEELGPISYSEDQEHLFLGREVTRTRNHSEAIATKIDKEMRRMIDENYAVAHELISNNRDKLETLAKQLLKYETLTGDDVRALLRGEDISEAKEKELEKVREREEKAEKAEKAEKEEKAPPKGTDWKPGQEPLPGPQQA